MNIGRIKKAVDGNAAFLLTAVAALTIGFFLARRCLLGNQISAMTAIICGLADAMVIFIPYFFIRPRYRWTMWPVLAIIAALLYANIIFFRNYGDMIPGSLFSPAIATNSFVVDSALHSLHRADWIIATLVGAVVAVYIKCRKSILSATFSRRAKILYASACVVLIAGCLAMSYRRISLYISAESPRQVLEYYPQNWQRGYILMSAIYRDFGITGYVANVAGGLAGSKENLSDADRDAIKTRLQRQPQDWIGQFGEITAANRDKNLIFIIVESLNSSVFGLSDIFSIAPALAGAMADASAIRAREVMTQAWFGRSADGQFILNTGLLPLYNEALVSRYSMADYPSLAKALKGHRSEEAIGESGQLWRHSATSASYGFDKLNDLLADGVGTMEMDSLIFSKALGIAKELPRPFYLEVTTLTMHPPFPVDGSTPDDGYLQRLAACDRALGDFIAGLKANGLYDNSIIVITGDHEAGKNGLSTRLQTDYVPLIILNAGTGLEVPHPAEQTDIYPTILDAMGSTDYPWRGFGSSLLRVGYRPVNNDDWQLASKAIRGHYFNK